MKNLFKSKTAIIIAAAVLVVAVLTVVLVLLLGGGKEESYRTVKVYQIDGKAEIYRNGGEPMAPYVNMLLESNDEVKTLEDGYLYIKLDEDKYLMASPNSSFTLEAKGKAENGKTYIQLNSGDIKVHVINPLADDAEFSVSTGNSTMAIRGTSFGVSVDTVDGKTVSTYDVYDGSIEVNADGEFLIKEGNNIQVTTENDGSIATVEGEVDYSDLDVPSLDFIKFGIEQGNEMTITPDQIDDIIDNKNSGKVTVTFKYGDKVFAVIPVAKGSYVINPILKPSGNGTWDFDFTQPIYEDTVIDWKH